MAEKKVKVGFLFTVERALVQPYEIVVTLRRAYDRWLTTIVFLCIILRVRLIDVSAFKNKSEEDKE